MLPRLKVCGVSSPASAEQLDGLASYIGTVVAPPGLSPRAATAADARRVAESLHASRHVTVSAGMSPWQGLLAAAEAGSQVLQPHVPVEPGELQLLALEAEKQGIRLAPVLQYSHRRGWIPVPPRRLRQALSGYQGVLEYVLVDAAKGEEPPRPRGWGLRVPPGALQDAARGLQGLPLAVAGGVDSGNACQAVRMGAVVVDASSRLDRRGMPGVKDLGAVAELLAAIGRCGRGG